MLVLRRTHAYYVSNFVGTKKFYHNLPIFSSFLSFQFFVRTFVNRRITFWLYTCNVVRWNFSSLTGDCCTRIYKWLTLRFVSSLTYFTLVSTNRLKESRYPFVKQMAMRYFSLEKFERAFKFTAIDIIMCKRYKGPIILSTSPLPLIALYNLQVLFTCSDIEPRAVLKLWIYN